MVVERTGFVEEEPDSPVACTIVLLDCPAWVRRGAERRGVSRPSYIRPLDLLCSEQCIRLGMERDSPVVSLPIQAEGRQEPQKSSKGPNDRLCWGLHNAVSLPLVLPSTRHVGRWQNSGNASSRVQPTKLMILPPAQRNNDERPKSIE